MDIQNKVLQYENFIDSVLRMDLALLEEKMDEKITQIAEFIQLKGLINSLRNLNYETNGFKTQVDLGNLFFIQANVNDNSSILLDIGLGHYLEVSMDEAISVIDVRTKLLEGQVTNLKQSVARTNAHIKLILLGIRELQGLDKDKNK